MVNRNLTTIIFSPKKILGDIFLRMGHYLFAEHESDNLQHVEGELSLVVGAGQVQEEVLQTADMERPVRVNVTRSPSQHNKA